jgi:hypothetical protein
LSKQVNFGRRILLKPSKPNYFLCVRIQNEQVFIIYTNGGGVFFEGPPVDAGVRKKWETEADRIGPVALHARLAETDSDVTAPKLHAEGFRELVTADPDGNRIRLFSWPLGH